MITQSETEVRPKSTTKTPKAAPLSRLRIDWIDSSEWCFPGPSELIEAEEFLWAFRFGLSGIIKGIDWVIPRSWRNLKRSWVRWHVLIGIDGIVENLTVGSHVLFLSKRVVDGRGGVNQAAGWIAS